MQVGAGLGGDGMVRTGGYKSSMWVKKMNNRLGQNLGMRGESISQIQSLQWNQPVSHKPQQAQNILSFEQRV